MSPHRFRRINRQAAEQLLRGQPVRGWESLHEVLASADAPPRAGELSGEQAAVAAFRAAHLTNAPERRRRPVLKSTLATLLTAKILIPVTAVAAAGGIAVAAANANLPAPGNAPVDSPASQVSQTRSAGPASGASPADEAPSSPEAGSANSSDPATPSPSMKGLCQAYTAQARSDHGKALESPAFTAVIEAAGGKDKVDGYCAAVLSDRPGNAPATPPGASHSRSTNAPETPGRPAGRPADPPAPKLSTLPRPPASPPR